MRSLSPPIRFLVAVLALWAGFRLATFTPLYPDYPAGEVAQPAAGSEARPRAPDAALAGLATNAPLPNSPHATAPRAASARFVRALSPSSSAPFARAQFDGQRSLPTGQGSIGPPPPRTVAAARRTRILLAAFAPRMHLPMMARHSASPRTTAAIASPVLVILDSAQPSPWGLVAWSLVRSGNGSPALASGGQLGDSQAGMRLRYRLLGDSEHGLAVNARLSRPVRGANGAEAAIGLTARPIADLPIEILAERRIAIERGGRDAWALGVAGGIDGVRLPLEFEFAGWAQAGIVGARSRDPYGEAAIGVRRPVWRAGRVAVSLGAGSWAAAQPGAARVDVGPEASVRFTAGDGAMRLGISWRERIAGDAAPGSGPALTLTTDF